MNSTLMHTAEALVLAPGDVHELVRGQEQSLVDRLMPIVRRQSVTLDMRHVERIDAAGIASLISLYGAALNAGNEFAVVNASHRVAEILALVGLDRILISHNAVPASQSGACLEQSAA